MRRGPRLSDGDGDALLSPTSTSVPTAAPPAHSCRRLLAALAVGSALGLAAAGAATAFGGGGGGAAAAAPASTAAQLQSLLDQRVR
jgi:hypothetical protein